ncbi:MAG: radical SAM protein, partial [Lachnospiraceae bacterium]|nr:radical SAM protein [Lachnospiraceae bacterium]
MKVYGLQKLTLLDFPGHTAATVFTGGCNLRCPFCHNAVLVTEVGDCESYEEDFVLDYLKKRQGILDGLAVTGGEPLLHTDIRAFIERIRALGYRIKLDTNGFFPERFIPLAEDG